MYLVYGLGCLFDYLFSCLIASCWCCFIVLTCVVFATCVGLWLFVISGYLKLDYVGVLCLHGLLIVCAG